MATRLRPNNIRSSCIIFFIKAPIKGQVKTRLAGVIGPNHSVNLYKCFIKDIIQTISQTGIPIKLFFYPENSRQKIEGWLGKTFNYYCQSGNDLGGKMANAFHTMFDEKYERVILIGSDLPDLPEKHLTNAFAALDTNDAVIGPAEDGGYYLMGFRSDTFEPKIFENMAWSRNTVYENTIRKFAKSGLNVHILPKWRDVDTYEDLKDLENSLLNCNAIADSIKHYLKLMKETGALP